ncbi:MAG TPA: hypothetical protein VKQ06_04470 [Gammaproteobacteria bacterium]|nr:hypothetical protein [Gammaproteobacteria bacterium]
MISDSFSTAQFSGRCALAIAGSIALLAIGGRSAVAQSDLTQFDVTQFDDHGAFFLEHDARTPPMMFREVWQQPPADGPLNDENRRITPDALTNPDLEYRLYGPDASNIQVTSHNGIQFLWNGYTTSPVALTLRHKDAYMDLTGLSRMRWRTRTENLHVLHAVVKLADGRLLVGSQRFESPQRRMVGSDAFTGNFVVSEVTFDDQRWFELDPELAVVGFEVNNPDLSRVDEIGYVDLMPGGGHGTAGCTNVSWIEVYATPRAR